jgi:hypothetical protein
VTWPIIRGAQSSVNVGIDFGTIPEPMSNAWNEFFKRTGVEVYVTGAA